MPEQTKPEAFEPDSKKNPAPAPATSDTAPAVPVDGIEVAHMDTQNAASPVAVQQATCAPGEPEQDPAPTALDDASHVTRLDYQDKEIVLVATAHVSADSKALVQRVIEAERPDSVCIELDDARYANSQNPDAWKKTDVVKAIRSQKAGFLLANLVLASYQKKMAKQLGTQVGGEMMQGIASAKETGAQLVLADRDIQTTFLRIWRSLNLWDKAKLLATLVFGDDDDEEVTEADLESLMQSDMLASALEGIHEEFPKIGRILIHERDAYLAYKIKNAPGPKVVAVLGGAHVPGVSAEIYKDTDIEELSTVPPKSKWSKVAGWIVPALIVGLIAYSFYAGFNTGLRQLSTWVLWNSGLAGLFTLLAGGHPLTILTAVLTAPIGTLNPLLAVGWFTALVQARLRPPTVADLETIQTDVFTFKGYFKNRALHTLLLFFMPSIGGAIGNFIGGLDLIRNLF